MEMKKLAKGVLTSLLYFLAGILTVLFVVIFVYVWTFLGIFRPKISWFRRLANLVIFSFIFFMGYIIIIAI